jgi:hypothetical protein
VGYLGIDELLHILKVTSAFECYVNRSYWITQSLSTFCQTSERDWHDVVHTSLGDWASVLAGIQGCNIGRPCIECTASFFSVRNSAGNFCNGPLLLEFSIVHTFPSKKVQSFRLRKNCIISRSPPCHKSLDFELKSKPCKSPQDIAGAVANRPTPYSTRSQSLLAIQRIFNNCCHH